jgi:predicted acyltransferase
MKEMTLTTESAADKPRWTSLDQFRGYTVLGMFLVNFVGSFEQVRRYLPLLSHHNTYCSYADTIMPQFFFAVGLGFRMTFLKRREKSGAKSAIWHAMRRNLALLVVAFFVHRLNGDFSSWAELRAANPWEVLMLAFRKDFFQTLTHIAFASLWILPVVGLGIWARLGFLILSAALFHLLSANGYYEWVTKSPGGIDGGVLGFMSWSIPTLLGTIAYDWAAADRKTAIWKLLAAGAFAMLLGYALSCLNLITLPNEAPVTRTITAYLIEPPFMPPSRPINIWTMSQKAGAVSYMLFGGGFSLALYAIFVAACDLGRLQLGLFRTLGVNALAGYILHDLVNATIKPFVPKDSPLWWISLGFALSLLICYACLRNLEKHKLYLRL